MFIVILDGEEKDPTRQGESYHPNLEYLKEIGIDVN